MPNPIFANIKTSLFMNIVHDGKIDLTFGQSRFDKKWEKRTVTWSKFLAKKLAETTRTNETFKEYAGFSKDKKDKIKDIGGFVGGQFSGHQRLKEQISFRSMITLDLDTIPAGTDAWALFKQAYPNMAAAVYSTHKHSQETPRLRLLIPLSEQIDGDKYSAICRRIAGSINIEYFDKTAFNVHQLMYWPSTSSDAEYLFDYVDAPWCDPNDILATYLDWKDMSEWPVSEKETLVIRSDINKYKKDPRTGDHLFNAFCKVYTITSGIQKYIPDVYTPTGETRWTFRDGSTANGMRTYNNDLFAYSEHATDPAGGRLLNIYDLIRLHLFGVLDNEVDPNTPFGKYPSQAAMDELVRQDADVVNTFLSEQHETLVNDFAEADESKELIVSSEGNIESKDDKWRGKLKIDRQRRCLPLIENVRLILENDPQLKGRLARDEFECQDIALSDLPWRSVTPQNRMLTDSDDAALRNFIEKYYRLSSRLTVQDGLQVHLAEHSFHPVRQYINSLVWDKTPRIDTLLIDLMGAEDTPYTRMVTRKTLVAAITRIMEPGAKFDHMLTLISKQGLGKSRLIKCLGQKWFSDSVTTVHGKEAYEQIQGAWLIEMAELAGLRKAEVEVVKNFVTKPEDRYRAAYGRRTEIHPRQCIFIGTTNEYDFLKDYSGNRRFWPVVVNKHFGSMKQELVNQIWAEAAVAWADAESIYLTREMEAEAGLVQSEHMEVDIRLGEIAEYLSILLPENWEEMSQGDRRSYILDSDRTFQNKGTEQREFVCAMEIWYEWFGGTSKELTRVMAKDLNNLMRIMPGWIQAPESKRRFKYYGIQRAYKRVAVRKDSV